MATQLREHAAQLAAELEAQRTEVSPRTHRAVPSASKHKPSPSPSRSPIDFTPSLPARALSSALSFSH